MLHERGVPVSSVKFAKTEANKPYICTVRYLFSLCPSKETVTNENLVPSASSQNTNRTIPQPITDLPEHERLHIGYNITHDAGLIAMAFEVGATSDQPWIDPPAHRIGVDVMHLSIPNRFAFQDFVETVGDAVRDPVLLLLPPPLTHPPAPFPRPGSPPLPLFLRYSVIAFRFHPSRFYVPPKPGARND